MKLVTHTDNDGKLAGAIVVNETATPVSRMTEDDVVFWNYHNEPIQIPEIKPGEEIFITDLALCDEVMDFITEAVSRKCAKIVHIDHHKSGMEYLKNLDSKKKKLYNEHVIHFFVDGYSACLLTWIYFNLNPDERIDPMSIDEDFEMSDDRRRFFITSKRCYHIPDVIRYVDDNDVWRHQIAETRPFASAMAMEPDTSPVSTIWRDFIYSSNNKALIEFVNNGVLIERFRKEENSKRMRFAFERDMWGHHGIVLNTDARSAIIFGDKFDEYEFVCCYNYDGKSGKYIYSIYSRENATFLDCAATATSLGGGGHVHAAGFTSDRDIFNVSPSTPTETKKVPWYKRIWRRRTQ